MSENRVLVIGTTPDYIAYIDNHFRDRALFVTDPQLRKNSTEALPDPINEILCDLRNGDAVLERILDQCRRWNINLTGITCFDCEWLELSAKIAIPLKLPYSSHDAVVVSRSKYLTKKVWQRNGVRCPAFKLLNSEAEAIQFIKSLGRPIVIKPLTGSGSELTFRCDDVHDTFHAYQTAKNGLKERELLPLYSLTPSDGTEETSKQAILAEEFAEGREYSADIIIDNGKIDIVRIAKKISGRDYPFGTTLAYIIPTRLPGWLEYETLEKKMYEAASSLGLKRAICMVDFMITRDEIIFLELTPRVGGDCLPPLIKKSSGFDMLGLALDFAEGKTIEIPARPKWENLVGVRLFSRRDGIIKKISTDNLSADKRVLEVYIKRALGHRIKLPPEDYDTWLLGHVIFRPETMENLAEQCELLSSKLIVDVEPYSDQKLYEINNANNQIAQGKNAASGQN